MTRDQIVDNYLLWRLKDIEKSSTYSFYNFGILYHDVNDQEISILTDKDYVWVSTNFWDFICELFGFTYAETETAFKKWTDIFFEDINLIPKPNPPMMFSGVTMTFTISDDHIEIAPMGAPSGNIFYYQPNVAITGMTTTTNANWTNTT